MKQNKQDTTLSILEYLRKDMPAKPTSPEQELTPEEEEEDEEKEFPFSPEDENPPELPLMKPRKPSRIF